MTIATRRRPFPALSRLYVRIAAKLPWLPPLLLTTLIVYAGALLVPYHLKPSTNCMGFVGDYHGEWYANWDGQWYKYIAQRTYRASSIESPVVFFPLYPLLGALVHIRSGLKLELSMLFVSLTCLTACAFFWHRYCRMRYPAHPRFADRALMILLSWPAAYFLRMDYTESLFLMLEAMLFYGFIRQWPLTHLMFISALATATRPTGVIFPAVMTWHTWHRLQTVPLPRRMLYTFGISLLSASGLWLYMLYLWINFGDPFAFVSQFSSWHIPLWKSSLKSYRDLFTLQPIWVFFTDGSWRSPDTYPWNLTNKFGWLALLLLAFMGDIRRWMTTEEWLFCIMALLIPYLSRPAEHMVSMGRYAMVALPCFLVLGRLLSFKGSTIPYSIFILMLWVLLFINAGMFALWYCMY